LAEWLAEKHEGFTVPEAAKFVESLQPHLPTLFQSWRPPDELEPLQPDDIGKWKNAFGELPPNPFMPGGSLDDRMWLVKHEPRIAGHLKKLAAGAGYRHKAEELGDADKRQKLRDFDYGESEHRKNPYPSATNLTRLSDWRREVGDTTADIHRAEAETPAKLPWIGERDMTAMMKMQRANPHLRTLVDRSISRLKEWAGEELNESQQAAAQAASRTATAKTLLATK
jgi:hypothetical protein